MKLINMTNQTVTIGGETCTFTQAGLYDLGTGEPYTDIDDVIDHYLESAERGDTFEIFFEDLGITVTYDGDTVRRTMKHDEGINETVPIGND